VANSGKKGIPDLEKKMFPAEIRIQYQLNFIWPTLKGCHFPTVAARG
jgi:hypothetical protein